MSFQDEDSLNSVEIMSSRNTLDDICSSSAEESPAFNDLVLLQVINDTKFPVLSGHLPGQKREVAVKLFPFENQKVNSCFLNEIQFAGLRHENVISMLSYEQDRDASFDDCNDRISLIIMELAPYGDFCDLMIKQKLQMDDKLARTFFRQLIQGLEYLHSAGVAHLDLKPENLLIGEDYKLKICDFDQACTSEQSVILSKGTECYRAPEMAHGKCRLPEAADVYSAGILLFILKSKGCLPYLEAGKVHGHNMFNLMVCDQESFWEKTCMVQKKEKSFYDEDFRSLFMSMVDWNPAKRPSVEEIKNSKWYNGPVYSQGELENLLKEYL